MQERAKTLLRRMLSETGLTQQLFGRLMGREERTISNHKNQGVIPATMCEWLDHVQEIRTEPGRAIIIVGMPASTPSGEYRRRVVKDTKNAVSPRQNDTT